MVLIDVDFFLQLDRSCMFLLSLVFCLKSALDEWWSTSGHCCKSRVNLVVKKIALIPLSEGKYRRNPLTLSWVRWVSGPWITLPWALVGP